MISRVSGILETVTENRVELRAGELVYEVMVPTYLENELRKSKGTEVELFVMHYLEGSHGGSALSPRLVGFLTEAEKMFYASLLKVPGLGARKALKTMVATPAEIASAIEREDRAALAQLPGMGGRTVDKVIASLKGKVLEFMAEAEARAHASSWGEMEEEAIEVLMQLAYKRNEAEQLVSRVRKKQPGLASSEEIVQAVFKETGSGAVR